MFKQKRYLRVIGLVTLPLLLLVGVRFMAERRDRDAVDFLLHSGTAGTARSTQIIKSTLDVRFSPLETTITPTQITYSNGRRGTLLVLPVQLENHSDKVLKTEIAHEWHGGIWPPTDLSVYMPNGRSAIYPVFLVGESDSLTKPTILRLGESIRLNLRMDWRGTGSQPTEPLMNPSQSADYSLRFVLLFGDNKRKQYVLSPKIWIHVNV